MTELLQSWLFFKLLSTFLQKPVSPLDLVSNDAADSLEVLVAPRTGCPSNNRSHRGDSLESDSGGGH